MDIIAREYRWIYSSIISRNAYSVKTCFVIAPTLIGKRFRVFRWAAIAYETAQPAGISYDTIL